ncbi:copper resistance CopC/CopD family protein [Nocardioides sp.]|uniref:copper resistance CopC/CopD family protein n=1 Tax=Nocardioides sp. TaxID=35761 RepID=UPI0035B095B8
MTPATRPAWWRRASGPVSAALVALALALLVVVGAGAPASAHAELVDSDPDEGAIVDVAPETVTLTFNEPVRLTSQQIAVYDAQGDEVASTAGASGEEVRVDLADAAALDDGTYVVSWNVLSGDGHPISGALTFSVGAPSASVVAPPEPESSSAAVTVLRDGLTVVTYVGLLLAAGLALFVVLVLPRTWAGGETRGRLRRLVAYAAGVAAVGAVLQVPVASAYAQGQELADLLPGFDAGLVVNEVLSAALVVVGLGVVVRGLADVAPTLSSGRVVGVGAVLALAGPSLVGHTRAFPPAPVMITWDVLHVTAGAMWLGGLVGLVLTLRALSGRELLAAQTLARFSTLAGGLLLVVAGAGAFLTWRIVGSWALLVETTYGRLLLVKVGLAVLVAAIGGWNRWRTLPAVRTAAGFGDRERAAGLVTRTVRVEAVLLVVLLGVTGVLVNKSPRPAPVTAATGTTGTGAATAGDLRVLAVMDPQRVGSNTLLVQVQDAAGDPYDPPANPVVSLRTEGLDVGEVTVRPIAAGTYQGEVVVPRAGEWEVQVSIVLSRFESPVTTVRLRVRP